MKKKICYLCKSNLIQPEIILLYKLINKMTKNITKMGKLDLCNNCVNNLKQAIDEAKIQRN